MMDEAPDRTLQHLRVDAKALGDVVEIMSRNGRRAIVKLDDRKYDTPADVSSSDLAAFQQIDVSSFWTNPERPHFGRRHYVYFLAGPSGAQYFGDSVSPEVQQVCHDLDVYFGRGTATATDAGPPSDSAAWRPTGWLFAYRDRLISAAALAGVLIAIIAFLIGRWTAPTPEPAVIPVEVPATTQPVPELTPASDPRSHANGVDNAC